MMIKKQAGFTMVELLITMVVFVFVMAAASQIFSGLLTQFKQQSKISETNVEGVVGLEIVRQDLEHVGYGLPWIIPAAVTYREATGATAAITMIATAAFHVLHRERLSVEIILRSAGLRELII